jgi:hypothetical protein
VGLGVDVRHDRDVGVSRVRFGDRVAKPVSRSDHERGVEGTGHGEPHHSLGAEVLRVGGGAVDAVGGAGDHDLSRGVVVGHPHVGIGEVAGDAHLVVVEAEDSRHGARTGEPRLVHRSGAHRHQLQTLLEAEGPGRGQRRVLAETVTGTEARVDADAADRVEHHEARHVRGHLRVAGVLQLVGIGVAEERADVTADDVARLVDEFPALVLLPWTAHPGPLRALSGKRESEHDDRI